MTGRRSLAFVGLRSVLTTVGLSLCLTAGLLAPTHVLAQGAGQTSPEAPDTEFFERVDVDIVNVDVYVTDTKGNPIVGLTRDDFRLLEDGEEQEITNFFAAEGVQQDERGSMETPGETSSDASRASTASGDSAGAQETLAPPPNQQLHLVLFVDHRNLRSASRNRVLETLRRDLFTQLRPSDRVTLVGYDGSVSIVTPPTADFAEVEAGLEELMERAPTGQLASMDKATLLRDLSRALDDDELAVFVDSVRMQAQQEFDDVRATAQALSHFLSMLSGLEGRKALVYVSDGASLYPGEVLFRAYDRIAGPLGGPGINVESESRQYSTAPLFEALGKQANAGRVTFYTILSGGQNSSLLSPAEVPAFVDLRDTEGLGRVMDPSLETLEVANRRGSLEILASSTGGRSTSSTFAFDDAIEDLQRDMRSYYSLGYAAGSAADAEGEGEGEGEGEIDHRIRVEVSNPDWQVRHRETYRRRTPDERMASVTRTALSLRTAENPLGVLVQFGEPEQKKRTQWVVPAVVKFPLALVTLLPSDRLVRGRVSIYVATEGPDGDQSPVQKVPAPIQVPADQLELARGQVAGYRLALLMREGEHRVAVTVRDELADVTSSFVAVFDPATADSEPTIP